jgi:F0F1-type ATP synthase membrane subunit a
MKRGKYKKKVIRINLIIVAVFILFVVIFFYIDNKNRKEISKKLVEEYEVLSTEDSLNDTIESIYHLHNVRGGLINKFITFKNGKKYNIEAYKNLTNKNLYFGEITKEGVILQKNSNSDTLLVKDGNKEYLFLID